MSQNTFIVSFNFPSQKTSEDLPFNNRRKLFLDEICQSSGISKTERGEPMKKNISRQETSCQSLAKQQNGFQLKTVAIEHRTKMRLDKVQ